METRAQFEARVRRVQAEVDGWLRHPDDRAVRDAFDRLATEHGGWLLGALAHRWAPTLWRRNKVLFAPLVRAHAPLPTAFDAEGRNKPARDLWPPERLRGWLDELDRADEVELFRALYLFTLPAKGKPDVQWRRDLVDRFAAAPDRRTRQVVLAKLDTWMQLDEPTALALYTADPDAARAFVLRHLPVWGSSWGRARLETWPKLVAAARERRDDDLFFELYRRQTPADTWRRDLVEVAGRVTDPAALDRELERRQTIHAGDQMLLAALDVLRLRGRDAVPWASRHLFGVRRWWGGNPKGYDDLRALALERGWLDVWGALVRRVGDAAAFDREVSALLARGDAAAEQQLALLPGVGHEWNGPGWGFASVHPLTDDTASRVYARWPHLVRGPLRVHVSGGWGTSYPKLLEAAVTAGDDELVDLLAARVVLQTWFPAKGGSIAERFAALYAALPDEVFPRRAASVLGRVPAFAVWSYEHLVQNNVLARLLFERSGTRWLDEPEALRDLLESPQIHVQHLAFRLLGRDDPRAVVLAADALDLLLPTLLRPLHTRTRRSALAALANAGRLDETTARRVLERARDAMDLPDRKYPKEALIALMGALLHRWPGLRRASEQPVVWGAP